MGWEEGWVRKKDRLGRRMGWEEGWVGKEDGLGRSVPNTLLQSFF